MKRITLVIFIFSFLFILSCSLDENVTAPQPENLRTSSVGFYFNLPKELDNTISFARAIVTASDMDTITVDLTVTNDHVQGTIEGIPSGPQRKFEIFTYDSDNNLSYYGHAISDVLPGQTITLEILLYPVDANGTVIVVGTFAPEPTDGYALKFDGNDDYVHFIKPVISWTTFTIEAWVKLNGQGGGYHHQNPIFIQRGYYSGMDNVATIALFAEGTYHQVAFAIRSTEGHVQQISGPHPSYEVWHHYAGVVDTATVYLYLDGALIGTMPNNQAGGFDEYITYVELGRHSYNGIDVGFLNGEIDEVRIWNRPLSQNEIISQMYTPLTGSEPGLVAYWKIDEGDGQIIFDKTNHGFTGVLGNEKDPDIHDPQWVSTMFPHK